MRVRVKQWRREGRLPWLVGASESLYRFGRDLRDIPTRASLLKRLRESLPERAPERIVDLALNGFDGRFRPIQIRSELLALAQRIERLRPRRALEIGTARGGSLFVLCRLAAEDAHVVSVDLPGGWFGGGYHAWRAPLYRAFARPGQRLDLLRVDSHAPETLERIHSLFLGAPLDYLLIDGDHTYEGVKRDFDLYAPLVRPGGLVVLHDIVPQPHEPSCRVPDFWRELRERPGAEEIVESWEQVGCGLGLLTPASPAGRRRQGAGDGVPPVPGRTPNPDRREPGS